jgi:glyoxylase I family protein
MTMTPEPVAGLSHVSLSVRDLDISLEFYRDVLGLEMFVEPFEGTAFHGREAMLRAGRIVLCLQAHRANDGSTFDPTRTGLDHLAFHLSTRDHLERWAQHLSELDIPHSPVKPAGRFGFMIELRDPDGTQIELFAPT